MSRLAYDVTSRSNSSQAHRNSQNKLSSKPTSLAMEQNEFTTKGWKDLELICKNKQFWEFQQQTAKKKIFTQAVWGQNIDLKVLVRLLNVA